MSKSTFSKKEIFHNISIVLVKPQVPENIGLCARVLKNTSFRHLAIVAGNVKEKSFQVAKRAQDVVRDATRYATLSQATKDSCFVFGSTRRKRKYSLVYNLTDIVPFIVACARKRPISILFGKENFGLSKEEIAACDSIFYIPADDDFPSYNLGVSCAIVCYKIFEYIQDILYIDGLELAPKKEVESLFSFIEQALTKDPAKRTHSKSRLESMRRLLTRTHLTKRECQLLKSLFFSHRT